ncbi:MAG TPA: FAD-dependent oxidoreductase, partial [Candidatus Krumholzibacteria bacterium]|nr:FAD-dependent oxidoreductase [Candidatus Krumholzibacteria bacterium]
MARYDVIVIGAGHNGLTTAAILAKAGRRVLVLERRDIAGGMCAGEEFHPGYRHTGLLHDTRQVRPGLVDALLLTEHGLEMTTASSVLIAEENGHGIVLSADEDATAREIASVCGADDAAGWGRYRSFVANARRVIEPLLNEIPPDIGRIGTLESGSIQTLLKSGMAMRKLGKDGMAELLRVPPMCVADWLNEFFAH